MKLEKTAVAPDRIVWPYGEGLSAKNFPKTESHWSNPIMPSRGVDLITIVFDCIGVSAMFLMLWLITIVMFGLMP